MLKRIIQAFILNRLHITISAPAVMWCWSGFLKMRFRGIDYLIITLAVACICQWNRLTDAKEDARNCPDDLKDAQSKSRAIKAFCYVTGTSIILLSLLTEPSWELAGLVAFGAAVGFFYNTPLIPSRPNLRLKNLFIIKNLSSGAGWSLGLLVFPMMRAHTQPDGLFLTAFVYMFAMVMTYEVMWDIRDVEGDSQAGIRTVPVVLGINNARICTSVLQFFCLSIIISGLANARLTPVWSFYLLPSIMLLTLIIFFPRLIRYNRSLSHILVMALSGFACLGGFLSMKFG
ncbi:MAG TPA: UbiA family prenyltransferase [Smithella sp.]|nr:UbiA family prenyltransferase [Smithella sp.]